MPQRTSLKSETFIGTINNIGLSSTVPPLLMMELEIPSLTYKSQLSQYILTYLYKEKRV
jgi:hypothetical protein